MGCKKLLTVSCKKVLTVQCKKVLTVPCKKLLTMWLQNHLTTHNFIRNGKVDSCTDEEFKSIENEVIDGAADEINDAYARMVLLKEEYTGREEDE